MTDGLKKKGKMDTRWEECQNKLEAKIEVCIKNSRNTTVFQALAEVKSG